MRAWATEQFFELLGFYDLRGCLFRRVFYSHPIKTYTEFYSCGAVWLAGWQAAWAVTAPLAGLLANRLVSWLGGCLDGFLGLDSQAA